jgi:hypothetical protein
VTAVRSGDWFTVRLRGDVPSPVARHHRLGVRIRSLQNAQIVSVVDLLSREPRLALPGRFDVTIELQANMSNGYFAIETSIWNGQERREIGQGTKGLIRVEGTGSFGTTNLHPRVQIAIEPPLGDATGISIEPDLQQTTPALADGNGV